MIMLKGMVIYMISEAILLAKIDVSRDSLADEIDTESKLQCQYQESSVSRSDLQCYIGYLEAESICVGESK